MDLSTMRKKLDTHEYSTAQKFHDDFKLMIRNCFLFNPAGTPVNQAGIELQRHFDDKWKTLPALHEVSDADDDEEEEEEDDERARELINILLYPAMANNHFRQNRDYGEPDGAHAREHRAAQERASGEEEEREEASQACRAADRIHVEGAKSAESLSLFNLCL